jgi:predicted nucleic acid-binding protein
VVLLDEKEGRHAAQRMGLTVMGVIGVLLLALGRNKIDSIKPYLDALQQTAGFYISESLYQAVLEQAKEAI